MKPLSLAGRLLFTILLLAAGGAHAQLNNRFISDRIDVSPADSSTFGLSLQSLSYLRNTEYFNDIELGRTLFGYQLNPSLYIQPNSNVKLQAGVFLRNDFGSVNTYTQVLPTFTLKIAKGNAAYTFGTLEGALAHRIIEPMFDIASAIERRIENGFDFRYTRPRAHARNLTQAADASFYNAWINWERFIERGAPYKEGFTAGINLEPKGVSDVIFVYPVFQTLITHRGGQINTDTLPMSMQLNYTAGLRLPIQLASNQLLQAEAYYVGYKETTSSGYWPFTKGNAWYANLWYRIGNAGAFEGFTTMLSYWNGDNFYAPRGSPLYQSLSLDKPGLVQQHRELYFLRFLYQKELYNGLYIDARFEPVYDGRNSIFDYSYSLYFTYRHNFAFGKLNK